MSSVVCYNMNIEDTQPLMIFKLYREIMCSYVRNRL